MTAIAHATRIRVCPNGCPVIELVGADFQPIAEAHISRDGLEDLIADLRRAAAEGEALLRPVV